jgi:ubiquitin C-terminal hydrolase
MLPHTSLIQQARFVVQVTTCVLQSAMRIGISNKSNYCFANTLLQVLMCCLQFQIFLACKSFVMHVLFQLVSSMPRFRKAIINYPVDDAADNSIMIKQLQQVLASIIEHSKSSRIEGDASCIEIDSFLASLPPQFNGTTQQDIAELALCIFRMLQENFDADLPDHMNPLEVIAGEITVSLQCIVCNFSRQRAEPMSILNVPVAQQNGFVSLQMLLDQIGQPELLNEAAMCPICNVEQAHTIARRITKAPQELFIQANLFTSGGGKNPTSVIPSDTLNMVVNGTPTVGKFLAHASHKGPSLFAGHYVAEAFEKGHLIEINDGKAKTQNPSTVKRDSYLMAYAVGGNESAAHEDTQIEGNEGYTGDLLPLLYRGSMRPEAPKR